MAQLDNAADSDSEERGFKSLRAGQEYEERNSSSYFLYRKCENDENSKKGFEAERKENSPVDCF